MTILGITGPTGAGKSLFSDYLSSVGIPVIDADAVYHSLLLPPSPCLDALRLAFGDSVLNTDGSLNRPALSEIVFHDKTKLTLLNKTVLGYVLEEIRNRIATLKKDGQPTVAIDAPTLIESGFHRECHTVISVLAPPSVRLERIIARDGISREAAEARLHAQKTDDFYREHSTYVLTNCGNKTEFFTQCEALLKKVELPHS